MKINSQADEYAKRNPITHHFDMAAKHCLPTKFLQQPLQNVKAGSEGSP